MTAQHAQGQGKAAARNVAASLGHGARKPCKHRDLGFVVDLGGWQAAARMQMPRTYRRPKLLAWQAAAGRMGLMVIEHDLPDVPDRQVQLADGFLDLPGSRMVADQPQRRFESEPGGEQPSHHDVVHVLGDAIAIPGQEQSRLHPVACPAGRGIARGPYVRLI